MRSKLVGVCTVVVVAGSAMADLLSPPVVDSFTGAGWNLGLPPNYDLGLPPNYLATSGHPGYTGIAWQRAVGASQDKYFDDDAALTSPGIGTALTELNTATQVMSVATSGYGAVFMNYTAASDPSFSLSGWQGIWMRYTVTSGSAHVNAWVGGDDFQYAANVTLGPGSGYLYFAFGALAGATKFDVDGDPDLAKVTGITLQFRSENTGESGNLAMTVTGGIIPAPGAAALFALSGLLVRRRTAWAV